MPRIRLCVPVLALLLVAPLVAQEKEKICQDMENRAMTVGSWATYNWTGGSADGSTMRVAVVGQEPRQGTTYYWYEVTIDDPKRPKSKMIMQMLVPGLGRQAANVRALIMKSGDQPAMRMPEQMVRMMAGNMGTNIAADIARSCMEMEVVGWEQTAVPAGTYRALHLRHVRNGTDVWVQPSLTFAMVKAVMKDGGTLVFAGQGTGAKSSITETPREMTGFPGAPPPR